MASKWFVRQTGKVYGPFDASRMRKLAAAGKILRDSGVAKQPRGPWAQASQVRGLFREEASPPKEDWFGLDLVEAATAAASKWRSLLRAKPHATTQPEASGDESQWFYRASKGGGETIAGPCSRDEIEKLVEQRDIRASTLVLKQGETRWETAFSAGLFLDDPLSDDEQPPAGASHAVCRLPQNADEKEEILWDGKASHHANYGLYALCAIAAPLIIPAFWGLSRYVARDCVRYQITSRRIRIKHGAAGVRNRDILLTCVSDAALVCPPSLQTTRLCNVELFGENARRPLAVLEGIPLAESALVISLCEAAAHRHIPVRAKESLLADAKAQEEELLRRAELRHQQEMAALRSQVQSPPFVSFIPPPPRARKPQHVSGLTGLLFGPRMRTIWVKGHYRGRKWIKPHKRQIRA